MGIDKINKTYRMGSIYVEFTIADGVAAVTTNNFRVTEQLYRKALAKGRPNIDYNPKLHVFTEKFPGKTKEEIEKMIEHDLNEGRREVRSAMEALKKK